MGIAVQIITEGKIDGPVRSASTVAVQERMGELGPELFQECGRVCIHSYVQI